MATKKRPTSKNRRSSKGILGSKSLLTQIKNKLPLVIIVLLLAAYGSYRLFSASAATSTAFARRDCTAQNKYMNATVPPNSNVPGYNADGSASQQSCIDSSAEAWAVKAYIATFGRAPESVEAYSYWADRYMTYTPWPSGELLEKLQGTSEAKNNFGKLTSSQKVDWLYANILQRPADAGGKSFWEGRLAEKGVVTTIYEMLRTTEALRKMQPRLTTAFAILPATYIPAPLGTTPVSTPTATPGKTPPSQTSPLTKPGTLPTTDVSGTPTGTSTPAPNEKVAPWRQDVGEGMAVDNIKSAKWGDYSPPKATDCYDKKPFELGDRDDCINRLRADLNRLLNPADFTLNWGRKLDQSTQTYLKQYQDKVGIKADGRTSQLVWGYLAFEVKEKPTTVTTIAKPEEKKPNLAQLIANVPASWWDAVNCRSYTSGYEGKQACVRRLSRSLFNMGIFPGPNMEKGQVNSAFKNAVWWYELKYLCILNGANGYAEQHTWDLILKGNRGFDNKGCPQPKPASPSGGGGGTGGGGGGSQTNSSGCSETRRKAGECGSGSSGSVGYFSRPSSCPEKRTPYITREGYNEYYNLNDWNSTTGTCTHRKAYKGYSGPAR
jgi:hypothetical protein